MDGRPTDEIGGGDDMSRLLEAATEAARRGDLIGLEAQLAKIRLAAPERAESIGERLEVLARCVRAHPSFRSAASGRAAS